MTIRIRKSCDHHRVVPGRRSGPHGTTRFPNYLHMTTRGNGRSASMPNTTDLSHAGSRETVTGDFAGLRGGFDAFCLREGLLVGV